MEYNKENVDKVKIKSKIPVPVAPLPGLPKSVFLNKTEDIEVERFPFKTINRELTNISNLAGTSRLKNVDDVRHKNNLKINTQHVTVRQKNEELDWDYKVFKDDNNSVVITNDTEESCSNDNALGYFLENQIKNCLGESKKAVTPVIKSPNLEPNRVKNIKRSLKRPHSRELQGISPSAKCYKEERHKRRLEFKDALDGRLLSPDPWSKSYMVCLARDYTTDIFNYMLNSEKVTPRPRITSMARACVINWLMKVNGTDGNPAVVQSAKWYLDSILAVTHLHVDQLQLVAAACYWIAQKLYGPSITAKRLVKCSSQAFSTARLLAAEKAVLHKLKFPTPPIVPQEYITYLAWCCDSSHPGEIEVAATFICMSGLMVDKSLSTEYSSVTAAAAVRNALVLLRKRDLMINLQINSVFRAAEKKTSSMAFVCSLQRKAVRLISSPLYEYKAPLELYNAAPNFVAQRIVRSSNDLAVFDTRIRPGIE